MSNQSSFLHYILLHSILLSTTLVSRHVHQRSMPHFFRRSPSLKMIDSCVKAILQAAPVASDGSEDPLASLLSSLEAVYMDFGIVASLTLPCRRNCLGDSNDQDDGFEDDMKMTEEEEEVKSIHRVFDSSWENTTTADQTLKRRGAATKQSGVCRGHQAIMVLTKCNDGM